MRIANLADQDEDAKASEAQVRLQKLPPEIGVLLIVVGTAGVLLPGPVGSPFLVAGGIALWPSGFRKVERWFLKVAPRMYETGIRQIEQFLSDLERTVPGIGAIDKGTRRQAHVKGSSSSGGQSLLGLVPGRGGLDQGADVEVVPLPGLGAERINVAAELRR